MLAKSLEFNTHLRSLFLACNDIGKLGADQIAEYLTKTLTLKHLSLGCEPPPPMFVEDRAVYLPALLWQSIPLGTMALLPLRRQLRRIPHFGPLISFVSRFARP